MTAAPKNWRQFVPMVLSYAASSSSLIAANAAQLVTFAILARNFGAVEFGYYVAFTAATSIAVHLCGLGASECLVRRVAQEKELYPKLLGHNLLLVLATGVLLVAIGMAVMPFLFRLSEDEWINTASTFLLLTTNIVLVRIVMLAESIYLGHSRFAAANRSVIGFAFVRTGAAALACMVFGVSSVAAWAPWQFASHVLAILLYAGPVLKLGMPYLTIVRDEIRLGILFATPFIFRAIRQNADLLILGMVTRPEIAASYGVARRITDSSYMAIDALNRLVYPGLAAASVNGIHHAVEKTKKILLIAFGLGCCAGLAIFILAPWLPLLFGHEYTSLVFFCRVMGWCIIFAAVWSVAIDTLGAAGKHGPRAWVLNMGNALGAILIAAATWFAPPEGTIIANYVIEIGIMIAAWTVLLKLVQRSRKAALACGVEHAG